MPFDYRSFGRALRLLTGILLLVIAAATPAGATLLRNVKLEVKDASGKSLDARVSLRSETFASWYPQSMDSVNLAHEGYAYPPFGGTLAVPEGWVTVHVSRGPEWVPWSRKVWVGRDTTVTATLARFHDLRARNFYASDLHVHSRHEPIEFTISPTNAMRIARAEDLAILHLLDQEYRFTGAPDAESDASAIVFHAWEHRHQTYGHVALPGLRTNVPWGCCLAPSEAWPLLDDLARSVAGPGRALFVLAHPGSSEDFEADREWPGTGLGREYPLLAARGLLNGFDVASYSNYAYTRWADWYDALSSGIALTPTAGTDAVLNRFEDKPAGGWRVYADMGSSTPFTYDNWIEMVRAGRTFVTSLPLIPRFRVGTRRPGEKLEAAADTTSFAIEIEARCVTGLNEVSIESSAGTLWSLDLSRRSPVPTKLDTSFTLRRATPGWMALRVDGVSGDRVLLDLPAVAHTNAVRIWKNGVPRLESAACGRMLDRVDALEKLLDGRRNWSLAWHEDTVRAGVAQARAFYGRAFQAPPSPFQLVPPNPSGSTRFEWSAARDPEPGDRVRYRITLAADSLFTGAVSFFTDEPFLASTPARPSLPTWWRIEAVDRGGNVTPCQPPAFRATLLVASAGVPEGSSIARPRAWPNPSRGPVRIVGLGADVIVVDVQGRRVAQPGRGLRAEGGAWVWDARDQGRMARPGLYWARARSGGRSLRITILE
jgi:hypothetical protein